MSQQFPEEELISIEEMRRNTSVQVAMALLSRSPDPSNVETLLYVSDKIEQYIANGLAPVDKTVLQETVPADILTKDDKDKTLDEK